MTLLGPRGRSTGLLLLAALGVALVSTAGMIAERHATAGWIPAIVGDGLTRASILGTVVGSAVMAWLITPLRATRTQWMTAASPRPRNHHLRFTLLWAAGFASAVLILTVSLDLLAGAAIAALSSHPVALLPVAVWGAGTWLWLVAACLTGAVLGWALPYRWTPLVASTVVYAVYALDVVGDPTSQRGLLGPAGAYGWLDLFPSTTAGLLRGALALGLVTTLALLLDRRPRMAVAAGLLAALPWVSIESMVDDDLRTVLPAEARCVEGAVDVCVPLPWAAGLESYAAAVESGVSLLPAELRPPLVSPDADLAATVPGGLLVASPGGDSMVSALPDRRAVQVDLAERLVSGECTARNPSMRVVPHYLGSSLGISPQEMRSPWSPSEVELMGSAERSALESTVARFSDMAPHERSAWWQEHADAIRECSLSADDLA